MQSDIGPLAMLAWQGTLTSLSGIVQYGVSPARPQLGTDSPKSVTLRSRFYEFSIEDGSV